VRRLGLVVAALLAAVLVAGCGAGAGEDQEGGAQLTITRDFGTRAVGTRTEDAIPAGQTVMRWMQRDFEIGTRYGGNFVQSIGGIGGGREDGRPVDWFYYINGIEASDGAAAHTVHADDQIWWDHHDWGGAQRIPAVVGSFPEPFLSGKDGKRLPVRLECADDMRDACDEVQERLADVDITATGRAAIGGIGSPGVLKVVVGTWDQVKQDPSIAQIGLGPKASGVYARPSADGRSLALLDPEGNTTRTLTKGAGLIAATTISDEAPAWVLTGTDAVGVRAAVANFTTASLRGRFAVAIDEGRPTRLPVIVQSSEAP
jgi:hypothetical protein